MATNWWRRLAILCIAAALVDSVVPTPSAASGTLCVPSPPTLLGSGETGLVIGFVECRTRSQTGSRLFAYLDAGTTPVASADARLGDRAIEFPGLVPGRVYRFRVAALEGDLEGGTSNLSGPTAVMPYISAAVASNQIYADFADRTPTASELAAVRSTVGAWPPTRSIGTEIAHVQAGPYWQVRSPVIRLFRAYFGRLPDTGGLDYWVRKSRTGTRLGSISSSFATSREFVRRYGLLTDQEFVELVYANVLGRPGDAGGIGYWTKKLAARSVDRGGVMIGFSESSEYVRKTSAIVDVVNVYGGMLRRMPTALEVDTWATEPLIELIEVLYASPAYLARVRRPATPMVGPQPDLDVPLGFPIEPVTFTARFGRPPFIWTPVEPLPPGLVLSEQGVLSGIPTKHGRFEDVPVQVVDADGRTAMGGIATVVVHDFAIGPAVLPDAVVGVPYEIQLTTQGATGAVSFDYTDPLPPGIGLASDGLISGTGLSAGTQGFVVEAVDSVGHTSYRFYRLTVVASP